MHIPDGYLGPETYGSFWAAMTPIWFYASRKLKQTLDAARVPHLAMASAFSLVVMMFTVPLPGGTSGHITGTALLAILLGPWAAVLAASVALIIQALVFGDGGITAIGANCFNIAFVGAFSGYGVYRIVAGTLSKWSGQSPGSGTDRSSNFLGRLIGAGVASYAAVNLGAFMTAVVLGLQPLLHPSGSGSASYFPYPLKIAIPAVMIPHLTAVGLLEAVVTVLVLFVLFKSQRAITRLSKHVALPFVAILFMVLPSSLLAHDFWIEKVGSNFMVVYGHGSQRLEFDPSKLKTLKAFDLDGREMKVMSEKTKGGILLKTEASPSLFFVAVDDGYWSKTIYGWKNLPKRKASRVVESIRSFYYSKAILLWGEVCQRPLSEPQLEIVALENPTQMKPGDALPIRVLYQGNPLTGIEVEGGDHEKVAVTDEEGVARVKLSKAHHVLSVKYKEPIKNDPDADFLTTTSTLTFEVTK
ncbi:MAG: cobalt transporter CbiM [Thermodesulfobacteriota bacterium]